MVISEIIDLIINGLLVIGGFGGFFVYFWQKRNKRREAAALIVTQIEDIKDKIFEINNISINNRINEKAFYECLDIITDNQWEKYRHVFIKKIDASSYKIISKFYECTLRIREQLLLVKELQHQQYFNIQNLLNENCNKFIIDNLENSNTYILELKDNIIKRNVTNEDEKKNKEISAGIIEEFIKANPNYDLNNFGKAYNKRKNVLIDVVNSFPFITYIPTQISLTLNEQLVNINAIEIIGCEGYRKLKKIAKMN